MSQRHKDLLYLCQSGNVKKVEKYLTKFGIDFLENYSISHLLLMSVCPSLELSYSAKKSSFNKKKFLIQLENLAPLISMGLNPLKEFELNEINKNLVSVLHLSLREPEYLLIIEKLRQLRALPDKALYDALNFILPNKYIITSVSPEFLIRLNSLDIKINSNSGRIVKSIILANREQLAIDIFNLGYANAWFYAREIGKCDSQKLKIYFESVKIANTIDQALPVQELPTLQIKKNKI